MPFKDSFKVQSTKGQNLSTLHPAIERMKSGPILSTLLRLAVPNVLAMVMQVLVGITETFYIGRLGTTPLAAIALVFPFAMLTQMMSSGAMGGAVSSAISRALGANNTERANTLAVHAITIGSAAGIIYTIIFLLFGAYFYQLLGGRDAVLSEAVRYSNVLFWGAFLLWLSNTLASILRGTGNMVIPSTVIFATAILQIVLGGVLGLGAGPIPSFGMIGVAYGFIISTGVGVLFFFWYLTTGRGRIRLRFKGVVPQWEMFYDILKVGALACLSPVQSVFAILIFTGLIARLGVLPLAGYGIGQRLEFLLIPISFGIGVASVPMVGMAIGAGNIARARKVAWTAGLVSAFNLAVVGGVVTIAPDVWATIFTADESVLSYARQYLRTVGPAFPFFGLGLTLYFASQGSGKVLGPVMAGTLRLALVAGAGTWLASHQAQAGDYFTLMAIVMFVYGVSTVGSIRMTRWGK